MYNWAMFGTVRDNRGIPVAEATVATTPSGFDVSSSDRNGHYYAYVADYVSTYAAQWTRSGYGVLPSTAFPAASDVYHDVFLPPIDNVMTDWGFETGTLNVGNWEMGGAFAPIVDTAYRHTGQYGALLGLPFTLTTPISLRDGVELWSTPLFATDGTDTLHLIWLEGSLNGQIYYAQGTSEGVWSTPTPISGAPSEKGQLLGGVTDDGRIHVVWCDEGAIRHNWRDVNGAWSVPGVVDSGGIFELTDFVVQEDGTGHLIWTDLDQSDYVYRRVGPDGTWASPIPISFRPGDWGVDDLAVGPDGRVHLLWRWSGDALYYSHLQDDSTWLESELVNPGEYNWVQDLYIDDLNRVHVVWSQDQVYHRQRSSSGEWSPLRPLSIGTNPAMESFDALLGPGNTLHVIWPDQDYGCRQLYHTQMDSSGTWSYPDTTVEPDICVSMAWLQRFEDDVYVFIYSPPYDYGYLCYRHLNPDDQEPDTICFDDFFDEYPNTVLNADRHLHAVWRDDNSLKYARLATAEESGDSAVSQPVTVPPAADNPTLSFVYRLGGGQPGGDAQLEARLDDGALATTIFSTATSSDWALGWADLSQWAGERVTVTLSARQVTGEPRLWAYLDEVTVGSAYADLWINKGDVAALPGEQTTYRITYGNRGGGAADDVRITDTLPSELSLTGASLPPVFNTMLRAWEWDVGDLAGESGPFSILVTATVAPRATLWISRVNTASIGSASAELETANNVAHATVFAGRRVYLPVVLRGS
jgi:uncharacterized repeat protein (TIGR01451 family)